MKSTQDLVILINEVAQQMGMEVASVEIFTDKSFRITGYKADSSQLLYDSDTAVEQLDINDLCYYTANQIWAMIGAQATESQAPQIPDLPVPNEGDIKPAVKFGGVEL